LHDFDYDGSLDEIVESLIDNSHAALSYHRLNGVLAADSFPKQARGLCDLNARAQFGLGALRQSRAVDHAEIGFFRILPAAIFAALNLGDYVYVRAHAASFAFVVEGAAVKRAMCGALWQKAIT